MQAMPAGSDTIILRYGCFLVEPQIKVCHRRGGPNTSWRGHWLQSRMRQPQLATPHIYCCCCCCPGLILLFPESESFSFYIFRLSSMYKLKAINWLQSRMRQPQLATPHICCCCPHCCCCCSSAPDCCLLLLLLISTEEAAAADMRSTQASYSSYMLLLLPLLLRLLMLQCPRLLSESSSCYIFTLSSLLKLKATEFLWLTMVSSVLRQL